MKNLLLIALLIVIRHDRVDEQYQLAEANAPWLVDIGERGGHGTLIGSRWVLTAAHVVHSMEPGHEVHVAGQAIPVRRIVLHPGWRTPQTNVVDDIALLELEHPVRNGKPLSIYRKSDERGRTVTFAGRGGTGNGRDGLRREGDRRLRRATNVIEEVDRRWIVFRFDSGAEATDLEGISGPGDSGGPALIDTGDDLIVAGVSSWQDDRPTGRAGVYGVREYYARVSSYAEWIDRTMGNLVLRHGTLWNGHGPAVAGASMVIEEGTIQAAGANVSASDFTAIDLAGSFVMPGLIDSHVHVLDRLRRDPEASSEGLRRWLCSGVTTLVDNGSTREALLSYRSAPPDPALPRIIAAGPILRAPGGYPFGEHREVGDADEARAAVAEAIEAGADFLKVAIEGGFLSGPVGGQWPVLSPQSLASITKAAHDRGLLARAHVTQTQELLWALDAGFDSIAHTPIDTIPETVLRRSVDENVVFVSTAFLWAADETHASIVRRNLRRYQSMGGTIALGTDAPAYTPGDALPFGELSTLIEAGLSPEQVLRAATANGALAAGRRDIGMIAPGRVADLIVVRGNPLDDLDDLARVEWVIAGGRVVRDPSGCRGD